MKGWFVTALLLALSVGGTAAAGPAEYRIKFATVAPEGSTWVKAMTDLDAQLRSRSQGQLGFLIYAGGIAGDELDVLRKIRVGQLHCSAFSGVGLGAILPSVRVLDLPMLFRDSAEVDRARSALTPYFTEHFQQKGFQFLAWAEVGPVNLFSKRPIHTLDDLAGAKVWVWSGDPIAKQTFNAMGINPIPLPITDVTTAINTGMIDTLYAPPLGALAMQWQNSLPYMSALPLAYASAAVLLSSAYNATLPPDLAALLRESLPAAMARLTQTLRGQFQETLEVLKKAGVTIVPAPTGAELAPFQELHRQVARKLVGELYPEDLLEKVYGILGRPKAQGGRP